MTGDKSDTKTDATEIPKRAVVPMLTMTKRMATMKKKNDTDNSGGDVKHNIC